MADLKGLISCFTAFLIAFAGFCSHAVAQAQDSFSIVLFVEQSSDESTAETTRASLAQLSDVSVDIRQIEVDQMPAEVAEQAEIAVQYAPEASVWVWLDHQRRMCVVLADVRDAVYIRPLSGVGQGGVAEAFAIVLSSMVRALIDEREHDQAELMASANWLRVGLEQAAPEAEVSPSDQQIAEVSRPNETENPDDVPASESPPPEPSERTRFFADVGYGLEIWSSSPLTRHGFDLKLTVRIFRGFNVGASYRFVLPMHAETEGTELVLRAHPVRLFFGYLFEFGRLGAYFSTSFVFDPVTEEVKTTDSMVASVGTEFEMAFGLCAELKIGLIGPLDLLIGGGFDVPFNRQDYMIVTEQGPRRVARSWPVRPVFSIKLSVRIL